MATFFLGFFAFFFFDRPPSPRGNDVYENAADASLLWGQGVSIAHAT